MLLTQNGFADSLGRGESPALMVTGDRGFIGKHFHTRYGAIGFEDANGRVDLRDSLRVKSAIDHIRPSAILHLAAQSSVASSLSDPLLTYQINFLGTLNLLQALASIDFSGVFLYVSSADIYGSVEAANLPVSETLLARPRSPYAVSKVSAEALCYQWSQTNKFRIIIARPFNQIGPGQDARFAIPHFARQIMEIRSGSRIPSILTGDLEITRDFTDVRDSVTALKLLIDSGRNSEIYNICSGRERTLRSVLDELLELAGVEASIQTNPSLIRPNEQRRMVGSPVKLRDHVGWSPAISIRTTLQDILSDNKDK